MRAEGSSQKPGFVPKTFDEAVQPIASALKEILVDFQSQLDDLRQRIADLESQE